MLLQQNNLTVKQKRCTNSLKTIGYGQWGIQSDLVHFTAPKQSHPTHASPSVLQPVLEASRSQSCGAQSRVCYSSSGTATSGWRCHTHAHTPVEHTLNKWRKLLLSSALPVWVITGYVLAAWMCGVHLFLRVPTLLPCERVPYDFKSISVEPWRLRLQLLVRRQCCHWHLVSNANKAMILPAASLTPHKLASSFQFRRNPYILTFLMPKNKF